MKKYKKVIFVTNSGTGRGPMAEAIFRSLEKENRFEVCSRGIVVLFPEPINQKTELILNLKGLEIKEHKSVPLKEEDFLEDTVLIAMEQQQKEKVKKAFQHAEDVFTLKEFIGEEGDIYSPYGEPLSVYEECFSFMEQFVKLLIEKLNGEGKQSDSDRV